MTAEMPQIKGQPTRIVHRGAAVVSRLAAGILANLFAKDVRVRRAIDLRAKPERMAAICCGGPPLR